MRSGSPGRRTRAFLYLHAAWRGAPGRDPYLRQPGWTGRPDPSGQVCPLSGFALDRISPAEGIDRGRRQAGRRALRLVRLRLAARRLWSVTGPWGAPRPLACESRVLLRLRGAGGAMRLAGDGPGQGQCAPRPARDPRQGEGRARHGVGETRGGIVNRRRSGAVCWG